MEGVKYDKYLLYIFLPHDLIFIFNTILKPVISRDALDDDLARAVKCYTLIIYRNCSL